MAIRRAPKMLWNRDEKGTRKIKRMGRLLDGNLDDILEDDACERFLPSKKYEEEGLDILTKWG